MSTKTQEILKRIAGFSFGIAFLMAILLFGGLRQNVISMSTARIIFMICGGIGLLFNLITFQSGKNSMLFNFLYWIGSIILFVGLIFLQMHWPFGFQIILGGIITLGLSFVLPSSLVNKEDKNEELLDDFN